ncbi:MAG: glycosyltransferase [Acidimicrobiales bacterium]|nr:glycosyltransferase [Acidimicrobiales bacterium]
MRIVHVFKDYYPPLAAGITRYIADIADGAAQHGWTVEVHVAGVQRSRRDELPSGVVVHRHREVARLLATPMAPGLVREVAGMQGALLHLHLPNPVGELGAVANRSDCPVVVTFHAQLGRQAFLEPLYRPLRDRVLHRAGAVLVASDQLAASPELARVRDRVRVLPYGVSPSLVARRPRRGDCGRLRVLFVGRLVYYKGVDVLLRAVASSPDVVLTVVGDGPLAGELRAMTERLGLAERVSFTGPVPDGALLDAYASHDLLVLPSVSRAEAFGLAMVEAMANGLPAISTSLGTATNWVNVDGVTGFVVPPGDPGALSEAMLRLRDPRLRAELGDGARARAKEHFSFDRHLGALLAVYEGVLS